MLKRKLIEEARTWIGTPYRHQGRLKGKGCDCVGIIIGVIYNILGYEDVYSKRYGRVPDNWRIKQIMDNHELLIPKEVRNMKIGDIALFFINGHPSHVGIISDYDERNFGVIHCYSSIGKVVEHRLNSMWESRILSVYKIMEN